METNVKGIWAIGDIAGIYLFKHSANLEATYCSYNAFNPKKKINVDYLAMPHAVFASPQIAGVGATEQELKEKKIYEKESYEEVIWDLMEDSLEISEQTKQELAQARADIKAGRVHTFDRVKKELDL